MSEKKLTKKQIQAAVDENNSLVTIAHRPMEEYDKEHFENVIMGLFLSQLATPKNQEDDVEIPLETILAAQSKALTQANKFLYWLDNKTDFYTAPASSRYHGGYEGGLFNHTIDVFNCTIDFLKTKVFKNVDKTKALLCAIFHDLCKIGLYEPYLRNVKEKVLQPDDTYREEWIQKPDYRTVKEPEFGLGHGVSSMYIAMQFIKLDQTMAKAIRWHMGAWNVCEKEKIELAKADNIPIVKLIQMADQASLLIDLDLMEKQEDSK